MSNSFSITSEGALFEFKDGGWLAVAKNGAIAQFEKVPAAFFPLLEFSTKELIQSYPDSQKFPWKDLMDQAAASPSAYWQNLSLDRIDEMEMVVICATAVKDLADKGLTQSVRHKAQRLANQAKI